MTAKVKSFYGTGRRKSSIARVYVKPGKGVITINGLDVKAYFPHDTLVIDLKQPLTVLGVEGKYDVTAEVYGGGYTGQSGAVTQEQKKERNTVLKKQEELHNSQNVNRFQLLFIQRSALLGTSFFINSYLKFLKITNSFLN